ncbi:putative fatty acyl-CoA reductase CG5065 [Phymastichus coffea]|uniref:putative fatty acyl-CoA reductase CG5065 n=1 Tax=Phymastichus coffea TaxID=108790 RepID=UPI00273B3235|nr:putative fatty acyl-CoA reductase CG5065 [Phymastichus coffea]
MSLREWYGEQEILLTGVTSELGHNLLEKLLRCFPHVKIHAVLRSREGLTQTDRVHKKIWNSAGFERLRQERPNAMSRVVCYEGNLVYNNLGVREEDHESMANVSLVFHTGGSSEKLLAYCRKLPKLRAVVVIGDLFSLVSDQMNEKSLEGDPDYPGDLPLVVVRLPPIGPAHRDPMPGYVEKLRGATALMVGAGHMYGRADLPVQIAPMDIVINTFIGAAWELDKMGKHIATEPVFYNASTIDCSWGEMIRKGGRASRKFQYPSFHIRGISSSRILHWFIVIFFEWLPSFICDTILYIFRQEPRILAEHRRVRKLLSDFEPMTTRAVNVNRRKMFDLIKLYSPEEKEAFPVRAEFDVEAYLLCAAAATRRYCVNEANLKFIQFFMPAFFAIMVLAVSYFYYNWERIMDLFPIQCPTNE